MDMCRVDAEKRMNDAAEARRALNRMRRNALHFTPHPFSDEEDFDEDEEQNGIPFQGQEWSDHEPILQASHYYPACHR